MVVNSRFPVGVRCYSSDAYGIIYPKRAHNHFNFNVTDICFYNLTIARCLSHNN